MNNELQVKSVRQKPNKQVLISQTYSGGARGVMVIIVGIGHGDTSSNPGRD